MWNRSRGWGCRGWSEWSRRPDLRGTQGGHERWLQDGSERAVRSGLLMYSLPRGSYQPNLIGKGPRQARQSALSLLSFAVDDGDRRMACTAPPSQLDDDTRRPPLRARSLASSVPHSDQPLRPSEKETSAQPSRFLMLISRHQAQTYNVTPITPIVPPAHQPLGRGSDT